MKQLRMILKAQEGYFALDASTVNKYEDGDEQRAAIWHGCLGQPALWVPYCWSLFVVSFVFFTVEVRRTK